MMKKMLLFLIGALIFFSCRKEPSPIKSPELGYRTIRYTFIYNTHNDRVTLQYIGDESFWQNQKTDTLTTVSARIHIGAKAEARMTTGEEYKSFIRIEIFDDRNQLLDSSSQYGYKYVAHRVEIR